MIWEQSRQFTISLNNDEYFTAEEIKENINQYKNEQIKVWEEIIEYQFGDIIGQGCFGQVYRGFDLNTGKIMAIK